jgi:hypothetical protein
MSQNKQEYNIVVGPDGTMRFIYDDSFADLLDEGESVTTRASYVEPGKDGWTADLSPVNGPVLGPFRLRSEALAAETDWLREHLFSGN